MSSLIGKFIEDSVSSLCVNNGVRPHSFSSPRISFECTRSLERTCLVIRSERRTAFFHSFPYLASRWSSCLVWWTSKIRDVMTQVIASSQDPQRRGKCLIYILVDWPWVEEENYRRWFRYVFYCTCLLFPVIAPLPFLVNAIILGYYIRSALASATCYQRSPNSNITIENYLSLSYSQDQTQYWCGYPPRQVIAVKSIVHY